MRLLFRIRSLTDSYNFFVWDLEFITWKLSMTCLHIIQEWAWLVCPFKWPHLVSYSWKAGFSLGLVLPVVYVMVMSSCEANRCCCGCSCCGLSLTARVCYSLLNLEQVVLMYFGINVYTCLCTYVAMNLRESKRVHGTEMMDLLFPKCSILVRRKLYSTTSTK